MLALLCLVAQILISQHHNDDPWSPARARAQLLDYLIQFPLDLSEVIRLSVVFLKDGAEHCQDVLNNEPQATTVFQARLKAIGSNDDVITEANETLDGFQSGTEILMGALLEMRRAMARCLSDEAEVADHYAAFRQARIVGVATLLNRIIQKIETCPGKEVRPIISAALGNGFASALSAMRTAVPDTDDARDSNGDTNGGVSSLPTEHEWSAIFEKILDVPRPDQDPGRDQAAGR